MTHLINISQNSHFTLDALPYGVFKTSQGDCHVGVAIGDKIIDLFEIANLGLFSKIISNGDVFRSGSLNAFISLGKEVCSLWT